ncbi:MULTISPECIES: reverse transcriptase domain-containing protein [Lelliottia]|uniref:reverse transcriptase domain-containing protein n=1 Tax=Lelliottia TaxID=1330545 RepID=UPI00351A80BB
MVKMELWRQVTRHVIDTRLIRLIRQYLWYSGEDAGEIIIPQTGIPQGCALRSLFGASLPYHVDCRFNVVEDICYARYMDDFLLLAKTRWRLRSCVRQLNTYFEMHAFRCHPDNTFTGRVSRGFDWLGVEFNDHGATGISTRAREHHHERCQRLYEQALRREEGIDAALARVQDYRKRWLQWADGLLRNAGLAPSGSLLPAITIRENKTWHKMHRYSVSTGEPSAQPPTPLMDIDAIPTHHTTLPRRRTTYQHTGATVRV